MNLIDLEDATELPIFCKANRTLDMQINLNRDTSGKTYKLQVKNHDDLILSFSTGSGLSILSQAIKLSKSPTEMDVPTGCYGYDLVEIDTVSSNAQNIFFGWFVIKPSYTSL